MSLSLGWFVLGACILVGCGGADIGGTPRLHGGAGAAGDAPQPADAPAAAVNAAPTEGCPSDLPSAVSVANEEASDLRFVDGSLVYRSGDHVVRVGKDGSARTLLYSSKTLVRAFVDTDAVVAVESVAQNDPVATFKIVALGAGAASREITTAFGPTASYVFGSDATNYYALGDGDKPSIVAIGKAGGDAQTLAQIDGVVSFPQVVGDAIWFVVDGRHVNKLAIVAGGAGGVAPTEVFARASCALAIGDDSAFCSTGTAIEQRALTGGTTKTLLEADKSKVPAALGAALSAGDTVFVRSTPQAAGSPYGDVLRAVRTSGDERLLACGRQGIHDVVVDGASIAWAEGQSGAFVAPR